MSAGSSSNGARTPRPKRRSRIAGAISLRRRGFWSCSALSFLPASCARREERTLVRRPDEVADEGDQSGLAGALQSLRRDDLLHVREARNHVVVDQDIVIFGPVTDFARRAMHAVGDHLLVIGPAGVQPPLEL